MGKSGSANNEVIDQENTTSTFEDTFSSSVIAPENEDSMSYWRTWHCCRVQYAYQLLSRIWINFVTLCSAFGLIILLAFWFYGGFGTLVLLHIAVLGLLYNAQDLLLYYPEQPPQSRLFVDLPSSLSLPFNNVTVRTVDGVQLNMFFIKQPASLLGNAPTVIYFHGNAGNIGHRLANAFGLFHNCKANILLVEYRGYGKNQGHPSEAGLCLDGQAALDYVFSQPDINQQKLVVFGRSLGGAVAIRLCSMPYYATRIGCLVVENTFTSIREMAYTLVDFKFLHYIPDWCYKNKFPSQSCINKIQLPSLFVCGLSDNLVPPKMMLQLYNVSGSRLKRLALFQEGSHNDTWQCPGYYGIINRFFSEVNESLRGKSVPTEGTYPVDLQNYEDEG